MKEKYIEARVAFEKELYSHNGTLFFNYDPEHKRFYHSTSENMHTVMKGYGPNPMGLVDERTTVTGNITFSEDTIRFCVKSEIVPDNIKQILAIGEGPTVQAA